MTEEEYSVVATTFLPVALLWPLLGIPLIMGKVPRNRLYGFRLPMTLADDRIWYPVNRSAGWYMVCNGVVILLMVIGTMSGLFRASVFVMRLVLLLSLALGVVLGISKARSIKRALDARAHADG